MPGGGQGGVAEVFRGAANLRKKLDKAGVSPRPAACWPKGSSVAKIGGRWSGGAGEAPALPPKPPPEELPPRSWTIGHNQGPSLDQPPEIPSEEELPPDHEDWRFAKDAAKLAAKSRREDCHIRIALEATIGGPVGDPACWHWDGLLIGSIVIYLRSNPTSIRQRHGRNCNRTADLDM